MKAEEGCVECCRVVGEVMETSREPALSAHHEQPPRGVPAASVHDEGAVVLSK